MGYYIGTTETDFLNSLSGNDALVLNLDAGSRSSYGGSGSTWTDIAGSQQNATLFNSPSFVIDDAKGGCFSFNGTNQYATVPDVTGVTDFASTDFTIDLWVKPTDASLRTIVDKGSGSYKIYLDGQTYIGVGGGTISSPFTSISTNVWSNLVIAFDSSGINNLVNRYKNGGENNYPFSFYDQGSLSNSTANASELQIGRSINGTEYFQGKIAVVKIYNKTLNASEVLANYNAYKGRFGL